MWSYVRKGPSCPFPKNETEILYVYSDFSEPHKLIASYKILLYPDEQRRTMTLRSNDTLVDTPFQLISGFFHVNQGVLCC